jgi:hypothetical protein
MTAFEPGKWYLAVECRNPLCRRAIAICEAPDDPEEGVAVDEEMRLKCPHCGRTGVYRPFDVRRIQAAGRP